MSVRASRTILIRLVAPVGTCRLAVLPASTPNRLKELKALLPLSVVVVMLTVLADDRLSWVAVRPSVAIASSGPAIAGGTIPAAVPSAAASNAARRLRPVPPLLRPLAFSATATHMLSASFQTIR